MSIRLIADVVNQLGSPALYSNSLANRPPAGFGGRLFISSDTHEIYQDVITGWNLIADAGAGAGTLDSVTHNGNTTTWGINILGGDLTLQATQKLYVIGLANGGVLFPSGGSGLIDQDTTNFVWDNTNKRLGLGTATPGVRLDIHSSTGVNAQFNGTGVTNATLQMQSAGTSKWTLGNYYNGGNNDFSIYDNVNGSYRAYFLNTGYAIFPNSVIIGSSSRSSSYGFDVTGNTNITGTFRTTGAATFSSSVAVTTFAQFNASTLRLGNDSNSGYNSIAFQGDSADGNNKIFAGSTTNDGVYIAAKTGQGIRCWVNGSTLALFINSSGKVAISAPTAADAFAVQAVANYNAAVLTGAATSGQSYGLNIKASTTTADYSLLIQNQAASTDFFKIRGGDGIIITNSGVYGNTSVTAANMIIYAGYDLGRTISSARYKTQIEDIEKFFIDNIYKMKPRYYRSLCEKDKKEWSHFGFIAEEMAEIEPRFVHFREDEEGNQIAEGVQYDRITALLVAAIQELNEKLIRNNIN